MPSAFISCDTIDAVSNPDANPERVILLEPLVVLVLELLELLELLALSDVIVELVVPFVLTTLTKCKHHLYPLIT
jgi:hypothetical protein